MKKVFMLLLAWCARLYIKRTRPYIIGITGSVGKTSCRLLITQMLQQQLPQLRVDTSKKNFNSEIGLCLAILGIQSYTPTVLATLGTLLRAVWIGLVGFVRADVLVLEYGIDHPGDMDVLIDIARPHMSVFTQVDKVHATYFPTAEAIFTEKIKLFTATQDVAFYGYDLVDRIVPEHFTCDLLSFATHEDQNETDIGFNAFSYRRQDEQIGSAFIVCEGEDRMSQIHTNILGHEHAGYISLAYEIGQIIARRCDLVREKKQQIDIGFTLQPGRMSRLQGKWGSLLLDSTYNASPGSMLLMVRLLTQIRQDLFPERQLIFCLGEMRELGSYSEEAHRALAQHIVHADQLFLIGADPKQYLLPELEQLGYASHRVQWFADSLALGAALDIYLSEQEELSLVLFKGSQNTIFLEEAVATVLRFPEDRSQLCRQGSRWAKKKR